LITGRASETRTVTTHTITASNATGSASRTLSLRVNGDLGDVGPGGGRIFYYSAAGFNCGTNFTTTGSPTGEKCRYLEAAPVGWWGGVTETNTSWANTNTTITGIANENDVGIGSSQTRQIISSGFYTHTAAQSASSYSPTINGQVVNDWYLGSQREMVELLTSTIATGMTGTNVNYWSSTSVGLDNARFVNVNGVTITRSGLTKITTTPYLRPIRAF
jgi:hypothetical protein